MMGRYVRIYIGLSCVDSDREMIMGKYVRRIVQLLVTKNCTKIVLELY